MQACRLAVSDLACRRGERVLFAGLSLALDSGQALHVRGPNGVGKSSLLRILAGLLAPIAGTVERQGAVALLDERPALDPHQPLEAALAFWARIDRVDLPDREATTDRMGLSDLLDVPVRYLSTGQKKRAALARMQLQAAPIWLLDEPLNGLDREAVSIVEALVGEHCAAGGIAVIASHQPFGLAELTALELMARVA